MSNRVNWSDPAVTAVFEQMIAVLINRLYPGSCRIDGSGGDEGRDIILPLQTGVEIFELKSFTGRMTTGRRAQVKASLTRAAEHNPQAWHLVVPIQATPKEGTWFRKLVSGYSFKCDWLGLDWLNEHMADHPQLRRYYIENSDAEIVRALVELQKEQAVLANGIPDAIERFGVLANRLNELSPHYVFACSIGTDRSVQIKVVPCYLGAERDAPISVAPEFEFPDTDEGRKAATAVHETFAYGAASTVSEQYVKKVILTAPAGLGGTFSNSALAFGPALQPLDDLTDVSLRVVDQQDAVTMQLPLKVTMKTTGTHGGEISLADAVEAATVKLRIDDVTKRITLSFKYKLPNKKILPCELMPTLRFCAEMKAGRRMVIVLNGLVASPPGKLSLNLPDEFDVHVELMQDLEIIQRSSGTYFHIPDTLDMDEIADIERAVRLMRDGSVSGEWRASTVTMSQADSAEFSRNFEPEATVVASAIPYVLRLGGKEYPLGYIKRTLPSARVESVREVPGETVEANEVGLTLIPGTDSTVFIELEKRQPDEPLIRQIGAVSGPSA